jgi:hypothetical protein
MNNHSLLSKVKGEDIACELNAYGMSVVGVDSASIAERSPPLPPFQNFIDRHAVTKNTPLVLLAPGAIIVRAAQEPSSGIPTTTEILSAGWRYMPGARVEPKAIHDLMVGRLQAGLPITLIPQTANALRIGAEDLRAIELSGLERALLTWIVRRQRRPSAKPLLVMADFADGRRRKPIWWPSLARYRATHRFAPVNRGVLRWADKR